MNALTPLQEALQKAYEAYEVLQGQPISVQIHTEIRQLDMMLQDALGVVNNCSKMLDKPKNYK